MKYQRHPQVDLSQSGQRHVLYHRELQKAVVLNPTGSLIWSHLEQPAEHASILAFLQKTFPDVPGETLTNDLSEYLQELVREQVLLCS